MKKRLAAVLLAVAMITSLLVIPASAANYVVDENYTTPTRSRYTGSEDYFFVHRGETWSVQRANGREGLEVDYDYNKWLILSGSDGQYSEMFKTTADPSEYTTCNSNFKPYTDWYTGINNWNFHSARTADGYLVEENTAVSILVKDNAVPGHQIQVYSQEVDRNNLGDRENMYSELIFWEYHDINFSWTGNDGTPAEETVPSSLTNIAYTGGTFTSAPSDTNAEHYSTEAIYNTFVAGNKYYDGYSVYSSDGYKYTFHGWTPFEDLTPATTGKITLYVTGEWTREPYYTVYNQGTGEDTKIDGLDTVDLTTKVTSGFLYAGYSVNDKSFDTMAEVDGTALTPVEGTTYCIREIPNTYLRPKTLFVNTGKVIEAYLITAVDNPALFKAVGFNSSAVSAYYDNIIFTDTYNQTTTYQLGDVFPGLTTGKLFVTKAPNYDAAAGKIYEFTPYYTTMDGVSVTNYTRTISNNGTTHPKETANGVTGYINDTPAASTAPTLSASAPLLRSAPFFMIAPPVQEEVEETVEEVIAEDAELTGTVEVSEAETLNETEVVETNEEVFEEAVEEPAAVEEPVEETAEEPVTEEVAEATVEEEIAEPVAEEVAEEPVAEETVEEPANEGENVTVQVVEEAAEQLAAEQQVWLDDNQPVVQAPAVVEKPAEELEAPAAVEQPEYSAPAVSTPSVSAPAVSAPVLPAKPLMQIFKAFIREFRMTVAYVK